MTRRDERRLQRGTQDGFDRTDMADQHDPRSAVLGCNVLQQREDTPLDGL